MKLNIKIKFIKVNWSLLLLVVSSQPQSLAGFSTGSQRTTAKAHTSIASFVASYEASHEKRMSLRPIKAMREIPCKLQCFA